MAVLVPDYNRYPMATDVITMLKGANVWPSDSEENDANEFQAEAAINSAVSEFEERTGWYPFLVDYSSPNESRLFDSTDDCGVLQLNAGIIDLVSVKVRGTALVLNTNCWLRPSNAPSRKKPYTEIQLQNSVQGGSVYAQPNLIEVTGMWGRVGTVPSDVWYALLRYAAVMTMTGGNQDQDLISISEDGFSQQLDSVGVIDPKTMLNWLPKEFEAAVKRWRRVVV